MQTQDFACTVIETDRLYRESNSGFFSRILALEKLGTVFNQVSTGLQYTPRRFAVHIESANIIVLETDYNMYTDETKEHRKQQMAQARATCRVPRPFAAFLHFYS